MDRFEDRVWAWWTFALMGVVVIAMMSGCATPSYEKETYQVMPGKDPGTYVPVLTSKERKFDNSTFYGGKLAGLEINYDPETYTPRIVMRYGRYESGRIRQGQAYLSSFGLDDVSLVKGSLGGAKSTIAVFDSKYLAESEKEEMIKVQKDHVKKVTGDALADKEP